MRDQSKINTLKSALLVIFIMFSLVVQAQWMDINSITISGEQLTANSISPRARTLDFLSTEYGGKISFEVISAGSETWYGLSIPSASPSSSSAMHLRFRLQGSGTSRSINAYVGTSSLSVASVSNVGNTPRMAIEILNGETRFLVNDVLIHSTFTSLPEKLHGHVILWGSGDALKVKFDRYCLGCNNIGLASIGLLGSNNLSIINGNFISATGSSPRGLTSEYIHQQSSGEAIFTTNKVGSTTWMGLSESNVNTAQSSQMKLAFRFYGLSGSTKTAYIHINNVQVKTINSVPNTSDFRILLKDNMAFFYINGVLQHSASYTNQANLHAHLIMDSSGDVVRTTIRTLFQPEPPVWIKNGSNIFYPTGIVGIGLTNPNSAYKLDIDGAIQSTGGNSNQWNEAFSQRGSVIAGTGLQWSNNLLNINPSIAGSGLTWSSGTLSVNGATNWNLAYAERGSVIAGSGLSWSGGTLNVTNMANYQSAVDERGSVIAGTGLTWDNALKKLHLNSALAGAGLSYASGVISVQSQKLQNWDLAHTQRASVVAGTGLSWNNTLNKLNVDGSTLVGEGILWQNGKFTIGNIVSSVWEQNGTNIHYSAGKVGIGTSAVPQSYLMAVKGHVLMEELTVEVVPGTGPDYVFEEGYNLMPLDELSTYLKEHKHLPEVPSAKDMEEKGLSLGEMNLLLLKKVEELTLHTINLQEQINQLNKLLKEK